MRPSFEYVCLDLDGTLLNSAKEISKTNRDTIKKLHENGVRFIIATGRHLGESLDFLKRYSLEDEFDYVVFADGSQVHDIRLARTTSIKLLSTNDLRTVSKITGLKDLAYYEEDNDYFVFSTLSRRTIRKFLKNNSVIHKGKDRYIYYPLLSLHGSKTIEKIVLPLIPSEQKAELSKQYQILELPSSVEVLPTDKSCAIKQLMDSLGKPYDKLVFFGDEYNDLSCFEAFPGVVMNNAPEELRRYSIIETISNNDDGVAVALDSLFSSLPDSSNINH